MFIFYYIDKPSALGTLRTKYSDYRSNTTVGNWQHSPVGNGLMALHGLLPLPLRDIRGNMQETEL